MNFLLPLTVFIIIVPSISFAVGGEENLLELKSGKPKKFNFGVIKEEKSKSFYKLKPRYQGNLASRLVRKNSATVLSHEKAIIYPKLAPLNKSGIEIGDTFNCIINQDIKAYVGSKSPIKAKILDGPHRGKIFVGNAEMDPKTKNILVWFDLLRDKESGEKHKLLASIHSTSGELGLVGIHHSRYWQHFFAMVMSRAAEGYAQATVQRDRNIFGQYQERPNPANAGKVAVAEAASSTADIIANKMKNLPEYVTKKGPIRTRVFITKTPSLTN